MKTIAQTVLRLAAAAVAAMAVGTFAGAAPIAASTFGTSIGGSAAGLSDTLWAEGFGYLGAMACTDELAARGACRNGEEVHIFQPVMAGRAGRVFVAVAAGRVRAVTADLHYVAFSDG